MSTENIMYIEIDQNKEFHNFIRFLEREFQCDGLFNFAPPKEESPSMTTTTEDIKLEPEVLPEHLEEEEEEDSDHIETDSEASQTTEAGKEGEYGCGKKFKQKKNLRRHEKLTHGELKYWCDQCDYKGAREREFRQHLRRCHGRFNEDGERPDKDLTCELCGYQTRYRRSLRDHMDGRHLNTAFPCQLCGKVFNTVKKLRQHEKTEREGGLQCDKCWKNIPTRSALNKHMRTVHD